MSVKPTLFTDLGHLDLRHFLLLVFEELLKQRLKKVTFLSHSLTYCEVDRVARPGGCTEGGHPAPPDSPFVVNPCHDVGVVEGGGSILQNEDVRIYHTNLLRSQMTPVNNRCVLSIKRTL